MRQSPSYINGYGKLVVKAVHLVHTDVSQALVLTQAVDAVSSQLGERRIPPVLSSTQHASGYSALRHVMAQDAFLDIQPEMRRLRF